LLQKMWDMSNYDKIHFINFSFVFAITVVNVLLNLIIIKGKIKFCRGLFKKKLQKTAEFTRTIFLKATANQALTFVNKIDFQKP
jgi:hypothetical protein